MSLDFLDEELAALEKAQLRRQLKQRRGGSGREILLDGKKVLNFSANDYLGLSAHPLLQMRAHESLSLGTGSTASRLITGNLDLHEQLEARLAAFHGREAVRLFNSGYQANTGVLSSLAGQGDVIISDALNHASMIDGCRLSRADVQVVEHGHVPAFEAALVANQDARRRFVVTDGVFSMDGDLAPLVELRQLCDVHDAILVVDDAHGVGALGTGGRGTTELLDVEPDVLVGTLGKAFGSFGAYVAGSGALAEFLMNRARSFVFSTALPPVVVATNLGAVDLLSSEVGERLRTQLADRIQQLREGLSTLGLLEGGAGRTAIFPVLLGSEEKALSWGQALLDQGIYCQAIRPPTVPPGSARLRIALSALHETEDVERLLGCLESLQASSRG